MNIFIIISICLLVNKGKLVKYGVDSVIQKYLNPMKRLTEDLPNHNVEVQLEIVGNIPQKPAVEPQRRYIRYFKQPPRRNFVDISKSSPMPISTTETTIDTTTGQPSSTTRTTTTTMATTTDIGQRPVYMDDLKKALEEFEKKFTTIEASTTTTVITTAKDCNHQPFTFTRRPFLFTRPSPALEYPLDRSMHSLIRILKSGVHLENPVPRPTNENLDWFQVKIPKTP